MAAGLPLAEAHVATGTYTGDGNAGRAIAGLGFRPVAVIVKVDFSHSTDTDLSSGVIRTATMSGDNAKPLKGDQILASNLIQSLDTDGFTLGNDLRVNALDSCGAGTDPCNYYWVAFGSDAHLALGTYTGDGSGQSISGVGFSPDYVVVMAETSRRPLQRGNQASDSFQFWAGSSHPDGVTSLDPDGFTVGGSVYANESSVTYHYAAWNEVPGKTALGSYAGDGVDSRSIPSVGFSPAYVLVKVATDTQDPIQRSSAMSGDASVSFRGALRTDRVQAFEPTGFQVGTHTLVNASGQTYFYVAFGNGDCLPLSTSQGTGAFTVTASGAFEMTFSTASGGGVRTFYDLAEDPTRTNDLAGGVSGPHQALWGNGIEVGGSGYDVGANDIGSRIHLLESTRTRVRLRQEAFYQLSGGSTILPGLKGFGDYSVYPSGRFALRWNQSATSAVSYSRHGLGLSVHWQGSGALNDWTPYSESDGTFPNPGTDDFVLAESNVSGVRTDFLPILYRDWTSANGHLDDADATDWLTDGTEETGRLLWEESTGATIGADTSEVWNQLTYFKPTTLQSNTDGAVTGRRDDYRSPDALSVTAGSGWFHPSENTASPSDFFNESEAVYTLDFDPANGLTFAIDGGTTTRYKPFFKIRQWRSLSASPDVTFTGSRTSWEVSDQTTDASPTDDTTSTDETHRILIKEPFLKQSGGEIRVKLRAHSGADANITNFHIAEVDPADDRDVVDSTWTQITFGGSTSVTVPAGTSVWSDWIAFDLDEAKTYSVTAYMNPTNGTSEWFACGTCGFQKYLVVGDQSGTLDWSGLSPSTTDRIDALEAIQVRGTASLVAEQDFRASVKPVSRAHFARDLAWHSTLESGTAVTSPDVGSGGTVGGTTDFVAARYGNGARFDVDGEYLSISPANFDPAEGTIEFWYRPSYDYGTDFGDLADDFALFGYWIDADNYFYAFHEPYQGGTGVDEGIDFDINVAGTTFSTATGAGSSFPQYWRANEWVHLRFVWKADGTSPRLEIYINGVLASQPPSGSYGTPASVGTEFYIGERGRDGIIDNNAEGVIDEFRMYDTADAPTLVGFAGLETHASEYLASAGRSFTLDFAPLDAERRGRYFYVGSDVPFRGLNVALATVGSGSSPDLSWQYWNGSAWADLESVAGFTDETASLTEPDGTVYWTADPSGWSLYSVNGEPELYYVRASLSSGDYQTQFPVEGIVKTDVLLFQYCNDVVDDAQTFDFTVPTATAVKLVSFRAVARDRAVELDWRTGSELANAGFHLYRAFREEGPYERITEALIPGLGSSPAGARYQYVDAGLVNGETYFYRLEDVETAGRTKLHGPVSATPGERNEDNAANDPGSSAPPASTEEETSAPSARITYGDPSLTSWRVVRRDARGLVLELRTEGFFAETEPDGTVRLEVPGFEVLEGDVPVPVKRLWVDVESELDVSIAGVRPQDVEAFTGLALSETSGVAPVSSRRGVVRLERTHRSHRRVQPSRTSRELTWSRLLETGYQERQRKVRVELVPIQWDAATERLLVARRLLVRLAFSGHERSERSRRMARRRDRNDSQLLSRLVTVEEGLYRIRYEELFGRRGRAVATSRLRLSRQGRPVAFRVEPAPERFGPGSELYFVSEGAAANPYGVELVYALELADGGVPMAVVDEPRDGPPTRFVWKREAWEENRYYLAGLLEARDVWLGDVLLAPASKEYPIRVSSLASVSVPARIEVLLQGGSDTRAAPDHHVRIYLNQSFIGETTWDGKKPKKLSVEVPPGLLQEGENVLSLESTGDTDAPYSVVFLERFAVTYAALPIAEEGSLRALWSESGEAAVEGMGPEAYVVDVTGARPRWVTNVSSVDGVTRFTADSDRRYLVVSARVLKQPEVRRASPSRLGALRGAEYVIVGPEAFLSEAQPLLELRRQQGLSTVAVAIEDVYSEYGYGETTPEAVREFLRYAFHQWPIAPRYVLLLGDGSYDFKDRLDTGAVNHVPPYLVKTRYLWTASDAAYASVHGDDFLPDVAIGRLPASSVEEVRAMVDKVVDYETRRVRPNSGKVVLVADDPDRARDFDSDADELRTTLFRGRQVQSIYLSRLGTARTRAAIREAFDEGVSLMSYLGHGGIHLWADERLLNLRSVASLSPQDAQPLVLTFNCLNGYFHFPYFDALSEALIKADGRGAIAVISPSGLSLPEPAHQYHRALIVELHDERHPRLGDAVLAAQSAYARDGDDTELLRIYHLMGDPALSLR